MAITRGGASIAAELAVLGPGVELHVKKRWAADVPGAVPFRASLGQHLAGLFPRVEGLVLVLALGATVRLIAPLLSSKQDDPAVVAVDETGRYAISVVGGHRGGANALAERVADALAAEPIVTTATDTLGLPPLDLLGAEHGWILDTPARTVTRVGAAAVNGEQVGIFQDAGEAEWVAQAPAHWPRLGSLETLAAWGGPALVISDRLLGEPWTPYRDRWVVYRPKSLVLGVGCSTGAPADEIGALARAALEEARLCWDSLHAIITIDRRLQEPGLRQLAAESGLPLIGLSAEELAAVADLPSPSVEVARHVGTPGVCEPAAVLGSGHGELVLPKRKSARATVAIARTRSTRRVVRGHLAVVGLGPGPPDLMAPRARRALRCADVVVGYSGYLEPLERTLPGKRYEPYQLGQERERALAAIGLARAGRRVALVSSGDAGIYGMAGLVLELLATEEAPGQADLQTPPIEIIPGITAATAAASLLGAPLMLDFAAISLSDLLVPWDSIERRLAAAASGDLVLALYNPASARRRWQLARASEILLAHRSPDTPIGVVREAFRPEQSVEVIRLDELTSAAVDMKTVVIVGNSATVRLGGRLVTRRGYEHPRGHASARADAARHG